MGRRVRGISRRGRGWATGSSRQWNTCMETAHHWRQAPRALQPGKVILLRKRRLSAWSWRQRLQVPAVHNEFRLRPSKQRTVKLYSDGFSLSGQQRKIVVAPENRNHVVAPLPARKTRMHHKRHAVAIVAHG